MTTIDDIPFSFDVLNNYLALLRIKAHVEYLIIDGVTLIIDGAVIASMSSSIINETSVIWRRK